MYLNKFKNLIIGSALLLVSFSSVINIIKNREYITRNTKQLFGYSYSKDDNLKEKHDIWSKKILEGGYILFFRHAERDKWIDVQMYDALETQLKGEKLDSFRFAENEYFANAVCLNKRGKIQAKAMGEVIRFTKLPIGYVVSSPSCRSRQTADLAFGGYDQLEKNLVHKGPYKEIGDRPKFLEDFIKNLPRSEGKNIIISAHNGVIGEHLFPGRRSLEEGGFYVLSLNNDKLVLEHEFNNFRFFSNQNYLRIHN